MKFKHVPLNLYLNFKKSAEQFPDSPIIFDEAVGAFPELALETTYQKTHQAIVDKASLLSELGIKKSDKVIIFKSSAFDTYLLAVAVSYLGAVPAMISYHLPAETMDILAGRLGNPWLIYDQVTDRTVNKMKNIEDSKKLSVSKFALEKPTQIADSQQLASDEIAYLTHTSGTTGVPKLIAHSANSMGWRWVLQRTVMDWMPDKEEILAFHISPVHSRFNIGVSSAMTFGFGLMPLNDLAKDNLVNLFAKHQPYAFETHPNDFVRLANLAK